MTSSTPATSRDGWSLGQQGYDHKHPVPDCQSGGPTRRNAKLQLFSVVSLSACLPCLARSTTSRPLTNLNLTSPTTVLDQPSPFPPHHQYISPRPGGPEVVGTLAIANTKSSTVVLSTPVPPPSVPASSSRPEQPPNPPPPPAINMAERALQQILSQLRAHPNAPYSEASKLLSKAKIGLLQLKAVTPSPATPPSHLALARQVYEAGALFSIRAKNAPAFTRYVSQLQPFYELADDADGGAAAGAAEENRNKVTGLYLLLLLTQGRYAEFHSELEALSTRARGSEEIERDRYLGYPIKLERWLMEGSYDRVWKAMKSREVPSEEYGVFSEILTSQIRSEIASSSERAYPSLPLSSTKSLLFLDSEGAVVNFARQRGWIIRDGQIFFPAADSAEDGGEEKDISQMIIENTLGYARELETIV
ncbi:putative GANP Nin1 mts3 eIF-3 p25 family protein [Rosellinia necatrix]|uniref:Putative GANP Nin1 mts3 eIF-3 p25 family protein n=1 Tax=Rosellinia necatrix TaxID=77044 RepID=A0A1S7UP48_ROSNE|nr:putative GANP Nin1 mts3 eIF-3 p25 family protein [Rosellinia necatrix]